jgi:hypothetical protein
MKIKKFICLIFLLFLFSPLISSLEDQNLPEKYKNSILIALEKYPELKNDSIEFVEKKINKKPCGFSRPKLNFIFIPENKHQYKILLNSRCSQKGELFENYSEQEKIGLIGHELAHIIDYKNKTDIQLISMGIKYQISKNYKKELERQIDREVIKHGLRQELYQHRKTIYDNKEEWEYRKEIYYTPEEILIQ